MPEQTSIILKYRQNRQKRRSCNDAGIIGLELLTIGNFRAFLEICPNEKIEAPRSQFQRANETNETQDSHTVSFQEIRQLGVLFLEIFFNKLLKIFFIPYAL